MFPRVGEDPDLKPSRIFGRRQEKRQTSMDEEQRKTFQRIFSPRSLAIVGISRTYSGLGGQFFLKNLQRAGYAGRIFLINPTAREIGGLPAFPNISALPEAVDLAIICIPAQAVPSALEECARKGILKYPYPELRIPGAGHPRGTPPRKGDPADCGTKPVESHRAQLHGTLCPGLPVDALGPDSGRSGIFGFFVPERNPDPADERARPFHGHGSQQGRQFRECRRPGQHGLPGVPGSGRGDEGHRFLLGERQGRETFFGSGPPRESRKTAGCLERGGDAFRSRGRFFPHGDPFRGRPDLGRSPAAGGDHPGAVAGRARRDGPGVSHPPSGAGPPAFYSGRAEAETASIMPTSATASACTSPLSRGKPGKSSMP